MNNGYEKLVAKIQHFYDLIQQSADRECDLSITSHEADTKAQCLIVVGAYQTLGAMYKDVFKDFLYDNTEDNGKA